MVAHRVALRRITIAPMRAIVMVIKDLYLEPDTAGGDEDSFATAEAGRSAAATLCGARPAGGEAPGIQHLARFGNGANLARGWRSWVAHWLGVPQYGGCPPASVAAAALVDAREELAASTNPPQPADGAMSMDHAPSADHAVWLVTPLHLIAGLTSVHFDRRSILRLEPAELEELAASFAETFHGSGFELRALAGGELLLSGPPTRSEEHTSEL